MAFWTIKPTRLDKIVADTIAENTSPAAKKVGCLVSYAGDEHVLVAAAFAWWLYSELALPHQRRLSRHLLVGAMITKALQHAIKKAVDQERPDRRERVLQDNGIPKSGRANDAFPSGHALHMGFLVGASSEFCEGWKSAARVTAASVCAARIGVLAHWVSDVAAGLLLGLAVNRVLRWFTLSPESRSHGYQREAHSNGEAGAITGLGQR